jgi:hypothetical protein
MFHQNVFLADERRRIVAYLDGLQAKVNALRVESLQRSCPGRRSRLRDDMRVC